MTFSSWLLQELNKRNWGQNDLSRAAKRAGYKLSQAQISNIINNNRKAGGDTCIAIAHALGVPREEVFRARGWLLREPQQVVPPNTSPKAAQVIRLLTELPLDAQEAASEALYGQLRVIRRFAGLDNAETNFRNPVTQVHVY